MGSKNKQTEENDKLSLELDSLDLLRNPEEKSGPTLNDRNEDLSEESLEKTLSVFSARMHKRFEEHREAESQADRESRERQLLLLSALLRSRKLLQGVVNLDLGPDIELAVICDDLQGWPRITLSPRLRSNLDLKLAYFEISGSDRSGVAQIDLMMSSGALREQILLFREDDLLKVPKLLKRCIRQFFDALAEEIIKPAGVKEVEEPVKDLHPEPSPQNEAFRAADLFEDANPEDVLDRLQEADEIEILPEL